MYIYATAGVHCGCTMYLGKQLPRDDQGNILIHDRLDKCLDSGHGEWNQGGLRKMIKTKKGFSRIRNIDSRVAG